MKKLIEELQTLNHTLKCIDGNLHRIAKELEKMRNENGIRVRVEPISKIPED